MNRRQQRRRVGGKRVGQRLPVEVVVNQIEFMSAPKALADMQRCEDFSVERRIFVKTHRHDRDEPAVEA